MVRKMIAIIILIVFAVVNSGGLVAASNTATDTAVFEISSLGIISGDENGNFNLNSNITRAEFAKIVTVMSIGNLDVSDYKVPGHITDVPNGQWFSGYISYVINMGLMNGYGDGTFKPNHEITFEECVKTVVTVLGYEVVALERGGYPGGYYIVAENKKLLKNIKVIVNQPAVRQDIILLIYNALDVAHLVKDYSDDSYQEDKEETIRKRLQQMEDSDKDTGVVTANMNVWLNAPNQSMKEGQIEIDGKIYDSLVKDAGKYIGQQVVFFFTGDEENDNQVIYNIQPTTRNTQYKVKVKDITLFDEKTIKYYDGSDTSIIDIAASARYVYNNRVEPTFRDEFLEIQYGEFILLDNNGDGAVDIIFMESGKDYIVESAASNGNLKLKYTSWSDDALVVKYINIMLSIDKKNALYIEDKDQNQLEYSKIKKDDVVSIFMNNIDDYIKIIVNPDPVMTGRITSKENSDEIVVDDMVYQVANKDIWNTLSPGEEYDFYINYRGHIIDADSSLQSSAQWAYGYIIGMETRSLKNTQVRIISAGKVENREEKNLADRTNTNVTPVTLLANKEVIVCEAASKVTVDGRSFNGAEIGGYTNMPIKFWINHEGKLNKIETLKLEGGGNELKYNAKENIFGGVRIYDPFMINKDTKVICIPSSGNLETDNLMTRVNVDNKDQLLRYNAKGYELNEETGAVRLFVITAEMNASNLISVRQDSSKMGLISKTVLCLNETQEEYLKITMMTGGEVTVMETLPLAHGRSELRELKSGDFIFYSQDVDGKLDNAIIAKNVHDFTVPYHDGQYSLDEQLMGYVTDIRLNKIDNNELKKVNEVDVLIDRTETIKLLASNYPDIIIYGEAKQTVEVGSIHDITPQPLIGEKSERVFMAMPNGTVRALVIIR